MRRIALLLLLVPLAGCVDEDPPVDSEEAPVVPDVPLLDVLPPVELVCPPQTSHPLYVQGCGQFGEPQLEVAGDGTIWYSAVCCVGQSPPIWISHDGGLTFEILSFADGTGLVRDAAGVEGDFAIDDAGNVYFFDITAATAYITKFEADGTHVHTKPDAFPPLVDRPWIRAGAEDEVFILYNTGVMGSNYYRSDDGGLTWDYPGSTNFPCPLMTLGQGPVRDHLIASGCSGQPSAWLSFDGGITWGDRIVLSNEGSQESYMQPAADGAGITYVPVTKSTSPDRDHGSVWVYAIHPDGTVKGPFEAAGNTTASDKPWLIAGKQGVVAMAHYLAQNATWDDQSDAVWDLAITYSLDAHTDAPTWTTVIADEGLFRGTLGRAPGDFLQLRQTPDGDLVVAYAENRNGATQNLFVRLGGVDFAPEPFRNGP